jgi:hypothetical protein
MYELQARRNKLHQIVYKHFQTFLEQVPDNKEFILVAKVNENKYSMEFAIQIDDKAVKKVVSLP